MVKEVIIYVLDYSNKMFVTANVLALANSTFRNNVSDSQKTIQRLNLELFSFSKPRFSADEFSFHFQEERKYWKNIYDSRPKIHTQTIQHIIDMEGIVYTLPLAPITQYVEKSTIPLPQIHSITDEITIGRSRKNSICLLYSDCLSRNQLQINQEGVVKYTSKVSNLCWYKDADCLSGSDQQEHYDIHDSIVRYLVEKGWKMMFHEDVLKMHDKSQLLFQCVCDRSVEITFRESNVARAL